MPATRKSPAKPSARPRGTQTARARHQKTDRAIDRITKSLDAAQKDLSAIGGGLGTGAGELRKDVSKRLRDARRDVTKMSKTVRRDLERLQKDLSAGSKAKASSKAKPARARPKATRAKARAKARPARARRKSA
jgi:septal ring factor EnvC (AmiA/AmiB activator)